MRLLFWKFSPSLFFSYSFSALVLPLILRFRVFLFAKARIATGDEGVLPFPRDLHKISILEARPGKNIDESRGPDDESLLLKPGPSRFNVHGAHHKGEIVIFTARSDFAVASRILSSPPPRSPFIHFRSTRDFAISVAPCLRQRFARFSSRSLSSLLAPCLASCSLVVLKSINFLRGFSQCFRANQCHTFKLNSTSILLLFIFLMKTMFLDYKHHFRI